MARIELPYGNSIVYCEIDRSEDELKIIDMPASQPVADASQLLQQQLRDPYNMGPLADEVSAKQKITVVIPDFTRHMPKFMLEGVLAELGIAGIPSSHITIVNGLGGHEAETDELLSKRLGEEVLSRYTVVQSDVSRPSEYRVMGQTRLSNDFCLHESVANADFIVVIGMSEPHLWAGYSGHWKALIPGVLDARTILEYHCPNHVGHPNSTFLVTEDNPTFAFIRDCGRQVEQQKPIFAVNYALDLTKEVTGIFCGQVASVLAMASEHVDQHAKVSCQQRYPVVIVTNGGAPADANLYQSVKGISAACNLVEAGGLIVLVSACPKGGPPHFIELTSRYRHPEVFLDEIGASPHQAILHDQWIAQTLADVLQKDVEVAVYSSLDSEQMARVFNGALTCISDLQDFLDVRLSQQYQGMPVAVMPSGFYAIPAVD